MNQRLFPAFLRSALFALAFLAAATASALCPHEVLVLANDSSIDSVMVAKTFMRLRGIPEQNLVRLELPEKAYAGTAAISTNDFTSLIWEPARKAAAERGIDRHILVWVYSTDFPFRVRTRPEISVTGLTFLRNRVPADLVHGLGNPLGEDKKYDPRLTMYASPLFAGPEESEDPAEPRSKTFEQWRVALLDDMPLPAMSLGWTGELGNSVDEVVDCLKRGRASDGVRPDAPFCVSTNLDVRSTAREWELAASARDLAAAGAALDITGKFPAKGRFSGFLTGMATLPAASPAFEFLPGAYADHFTSHAGSFHVAHQTKLCEWIRRGATATSGTVAEPYAYWQKFPNPSLFLHQLRGCTMVEAIYQSVRCPLQLLPVGDPLARPWGRIPEVRIEGLPEEPLAGQAFVNASTDQPEVFTRFDWLVDGRPAGSGATLRLDAGELAAGTHKLRAVARSRGQVRDNGFAEVSFTVQAP